METLSLIQSARRGDIGSYNALVLQIQDEAFTLAARALLDPQAAEEVAQGAFVQAFTALDGAPEGDFRSWVLGRTAAECWRRLRKADSQETPWLQRKVMGGMQRISPLAARAPDQRAGRTRPGNGLETILSQLPAEQRLAVILIDLSGLDYSQAAAALSMPVEEISRHLARARQVIARRL